MRPLTSLATFTLATLFGPTNRVLCSSPWSAQALFSQPSGTAGDDTDPFKWRWDAEPDPDGTSNMVFRAVSSLLQEWPNMWYRNGHAIMPASIPPGTTVYHGRRDTVIPDEPDWLAFDPDHSYVFCAGTCVIQTYVTTREIRLAYFDGASGSNLPTGPFDTSDLLLWGKVRPEMLMMEWERAIELCEWGKRWNLDGFIRMEHEFEIVYCNFTDGLTLTSNSELIPRWHRLRAPENKSNTTIAATTVNPYTSPSSSTLRARSQFLYPSLQTQNRTAPFPPGGPVYNIPQLPENWEGSLRDGASSWWETLQAGGNHYHYPGETRINIDVSGMVSFLDTKYTSLKELRKGKKFIEWRAAGGSDTDVQAFRDDVRDAFDAEDWATLRPKSKVDWTGLVKVIVDRYGKHLELLHTVLEDKTTRNTTERAKLARDRLFIILTPYMLNTVVPSKNSTGTDTAWVAPMATLCAQTYTHFTKYLPVYLTPSERLIQTSIEDVLSQICRVLSTIWVDAFPIERLIDSSTSSTSSNGHDPNPALQQLERTLATWESEVAWLMGWLDWSIWNGCKDGCKDDEMCYIPTVPPEFGSPELGGRCLSRLEIPDFLEKLLQ